MLMFIIIALKIFYGYVWKISVHLGPFMSVYVIYHQKTLLDK